MELLTDFKCVTEIPSSMDFQAREAVTLIWSQLMHSMDQETNYTSCFTSSIWSWTRTLVFRKKTLQCKLKFNCLSGQKLTRASGGLLQLVTSSSSQTGLAFQHVIYLQLTTISFQSAFYTQDCNILCYHMPILFISIYRLQLSYVLAFSLIN